MKAVNRAVALAPENEEVKTFLPLLFKTGLFKTKKKNTKKRKQKKPFHFFVFFLIFFSLPFPFFLIFFFPVEEQKDSIPESVHNCLKEFKAEKK